jgi:hypothetical protein
MKKLLTLLTVTSQLLFVLKEASKTYYLSSQSTTVKASSILDAVCEALVELSVMISWEGSRSLMLMGSSPGR